MTSSTLELTVEEIAALDTGVRGGPEPALNTLDNYGMPIPKARGINSPSEADAGR